MVQPSPASSPDRRRLAALLLLGGGAVFGLVSVQVAYGFDDPAAWIPDLLVGLGFLAGGTASLRRQPGAGTLLVATGLTWWLGNFVPAALFLHRGLLLHAVALFPGWRPGSKRKSALLVAGYALATIPAIASTDTGTAVYGLTLVGTALFRLVGSSGQARRHRAAALGAALSVFVGTTGAAVIRLWLAGSPSAARPTLLLYESTLFVAGLLLWRGVRQPSAAALADLVVELGGVRSGSLRDTLRRLLGDPILEIGFEDEGGRYLNASGTVIELPGAGGDRVATVIEREAGSGVVILHDRSILQDEGFLDAVASVTNLARSNATLNAETRTQLTALAASRQRLLNTEEEERSRLAARLRLGPGKRLADVEATLADALNPNSDESTSTATERALEQARLTREDLDLITEGLHPRDLDGELVYALRQLANRLSIQVELSVTDAALSPVLKSTIYYLCAEALSNVVKHASANQVTISVSAGPGYLRLVITDNGIGGADVSAGSGLRGLVGRVSAFGGSLVITSPEGGGTRLFAELPLGEQPSRTTG